MIRQIGRFNLILALLVLAGSLTGASLEQVNTTSSQTLTNKTLTSPVLSGTVTGTYTLGGTPTISAPILGGTATGTYTLAGTIGINNPTLGGTITGTYTLGGTPTIDSPTLSGTPVFPDNVFTVGGSSDATKKVAFEVDGLTASTTRTWTAQDRSMTIGIVNGTAQASTSGTAVTFSSIPSGVRKITVMLSGVSTSGTSNVMLQLGDAGGVEPTGYLGAASTITSATPATANFTTGFGVLATTIAGAIVHGQAVLTLMNASTNTWACSSTMGHSNATTLSLGAGVKSLTATLDRVVLTTVGGSDTFDAGSVNIAYEF